MRTIKLTDEQVANLAEFLNRVEVKGLLEATALINIGAAINAPMLQQLGFTKEKEPTKNDKKIDIKKDKS